MYVINVDGTAQNREFMQSILCIRMVYISLYVRLTLLYTIDEDQTAPIRELRHSIIMHSYHIYFTVS